MAHSRSRPAPLHQNAGSRTGIILESGADALVERDVLPDNALRHPFDRRCHAG